MIRQEAYLESSFNNISAICGPAVRIIMMLPNIPNNPELGKFMQRGRIAFFTR